MELCACEPKTQQTPKSSKLHGSSCRVLWPSTGGLASSNLKVATDGQKCGAVARRAGAASSLPKAIDCVDLRKASQSTLTDDMSPAQPAVRTSWTGSQGTVQGGFRSSWPVVSVWACQVASGGARLQVFSESWGRRGGRGGETPTWCCIMSEETGSHRAVANMFQDWKSLLKLIKDHGKKISRTWASSGGQRVRVVKSWAGEGKGRTPG